MKPKVVAIIPARGGSKGVPHKNRRLVGGVPLISYTLRTAAASAVLDRVIVTTDDDAIAAIALSEGAEVVMRPSEIASDNSPVIDAVRHVLDTLAQSERFSANILVLLQPTSPFRKPEDIERAVGLFMASRGTPVCSVCLCEDNHPARMYRLENDRLTALFPELATARRQDLPPIYHRNGSLYVFGMREVESGQVIVNGMVPYVMDQASSVNIDTEFDLVLMAAMLEHGHEDPTARA